MFCAWVVMRVASGQKSPVVHEMPFGDGSSDRRARAGRSGRRLGRRDRWRCTSRARSCSRRRATRSFRSARTAAKTCPASMCASLMGSSAASPPATVPIMWYLNRPASVIGVRGETAGGHAAADLGRRSRAGAWSPRSAASPWRARRSRRAGPAEAGSDRDQRPENFEIGEPHGPIVPPLQGRGKVARQLQRFCGD